MGLQSLSSAGGGPNADKPFGSSSRSPPRTDDPMDSEKPQVVKRPRRKWSEAETKMLVDGCNVWGVGNWKAILNDPQFHFVDRTPVDLKDRFRTYFPDAYRQHYPNARTHLSTRIRSSLPDGSSIFEKTRSKKRRPFSPEEDDALRKGYEKHGAMWAVIAKDPVFQSRRSTDLRDRFRNAFPELYQQAGYKPRPTKGKKTGPPTRVHKTPTPSSSSSSIPKTTPDAIPNPPIPNSPAFTFPPHELDSSALSASPIALLPSLSEYAANGDSRSTSSQTWDSDQPPWSSPSDSPSPASYRPLWEQPNLHQPLVSRRHGAVSRSLSGSLGWFVANHRPNGDRGMSHETHHQWPLSNAEIGGNLDKYDLSFEQDFRSDIGHGDQDPSFVVQDAYGNHHIHHHYAGDLIFGSGVAVHPPLFHANSAPGSLDCFGLPQQPQQQVAPRAAFDGLRLIPDPNTSMDSPAMDNGLEEQVKPPPTPHDALWPSLPPEDPSFALTPARAFSQPPSEHRQQQQPPQQPQHAPQPMSTSPPRHFFNFNAPPFILDDELLQYTQVAALDLHRYQHSVPQPREVESAAREALDLAPFSLPMSQNTPMAVPYASTLRGPRPSVRSPLNPSSSSGDVKRGGVSRKRLSWNGLGMHEIC